MPKPTEVTIKPFMEPPVIVRKGDKVLLIQHAQYRSEPDQARVAHVAKICGGSVRQWDAAQTAQTNKVQP